MAPRDEDSRKNPPKLRDHVNQNVANVAQLISAAHAQVSPHQRRIERATGALGRPRTTYAILLVVALWCAGNGIAAATGHRALDPPPFSWLQGALTLSALLLTSLVLTTQARERFSSEQREHFDLQINLLAEQKLAKLIALVEELRRDSPAVPNREDKLAEAMSEAVDPQIVVEELERQISEAVDLEMHPLGAPPGRNL